MRGAAFEFSRRLGPRLKDVDVLFATDLVDLAHLLAFLPRRVPSILYFHENQAAYPAHPEGPTPERDLQYAFTNLASALAADAVAFNSAFQQESFFGAMDALLGRMPDHRPRWALDAVRQKSRVLPLGVGLDDIPRGEESDGGPPVVLWNHRWEHDKDPETFFRVLRRLSRRGVSFRLAVAGESFHRVPPVFEEARRWLADHLIQWGYEPSRSDYVSLLRRADVVVSTARQENFGISIVEAAYAGAHPLAPRRLSYPEVIPRAVHDLCLYDDEEELETRLEALLGDGVPRLSRERLRALFACHGWRERALGFDGLAEWVSEGVDSVV